MNTFTKKRFSVLFRSLRTKITRVLRIFGLYVLIPLVSLAVPAFFTVESGITLSFSENAFTDTFDETFVYDTSPHTEEYALALPFYRGVYDDVTEVSLKPPAILPPGYMPIKDVDLAYKTFDIINDTDYYIDQAKTEKKSYPFSRPKPGEPYVLVVHTHATESFYESDESISRYMSFSPDIPSDVRGYYKESSSAPRSSDTSKNTVRLGEIFTDTLNSLGITALHAETLHDLNNYEGAYQASYKTVTSYLEKYPSIKYIIDIHRDSLLKNDGTKMNPVTVIDGKRTSQVMLVVGSNQSGNYHPNWQSNLSLALKYRQHLKSVSADFVRPIYLRTGRFNQQLSVGSMLLEIGSCGSTLDEAENAAYYAAKALGEMILGA